MRTAPAPAARGSEGLFVRCLAFSAAMHGLLFLGGRIAPPLPPPSPVEIDLTDPFPGTGPAKLAAPKARVADAPPVTPMPADPDEAAVVKPEAPREWTLPGPETTKVEAPPEQTATPGGVDGGTGISPLPGGSGAGSPYGVPGGWGTGGARDVRPPRLLNRDEVMANLRRHYPERERMAGRQGVVRLHVHIGADGTVSGSEVAISASPLFDEAAKKVARLMRFSPAQTPDGRPVAVKISQDMMFRLTDDD